MGSEQGKQQNGSGKQNDSHRESSCHDTPRDFDLEFRYGYRVSCCQISTRSSGLMILLQRAVESPDEKVGSAAPGGRTGANRRYNPTVGGGMTIRKNAVRKTALRQKAQLMSASEIERTLVRLAHEILEKNSGVEG